MTFAIILH